MAKEWIYKSKANGVKAYEEVLFWLEFH